MIYTNERPIELNKKANYFSFPGLIDKHFLLVGKIDVHGYDKEPGFIINKILSFYEYDLDKLIVPSRKKTKVRAKHVCYYILISYFKFSQSEVGRIFRVDHTTVLNGVKQVKIQLSIQNSLYSSEINHILSLFNK